MLVHLQVSSVEKPGRVADVEIQVPDELAEIVGANVLQEACEMAFYTLDSAMYKNRKAVKAIGIRGRGDYKMVVLREDGVG
jgi:hypothetical protein